MSFILTALKTSVWTNKITINPQDILYDKNDTYMVAFVNSNHLAPVRIAARRTRDALNRLSAPWGDNGLRIMPAIKLLDYIQQFERHNDLFNREVEAFLDKYPKLIEHRDFSQCGVIPPSVEDIKAKFGMQYELLPLSDFNDFRLNVSESVIDELKSKFEQKRHEDFRNAVETTLRSARTAKDKAPFIELLNTMYDYLTGDEKYELSTFGS